MTIWPLGFFWLPRVSRSRGEPPFINFEADGANQEGPLALSSVARPLRQ